MDAPPVHYVTTNDGYSIAYTICGEGHPPSLCVRRSLLSAPLTFQLVEP
jgi:hypothetical protein